MNKEQRNRAKELDLEAIRSILDKAEKTGIDFGFMYDCNSDLDTEDRPIHHLEVFWVEDDEDGE